MLKSCHCQTINFNAISETRWTKLISVCINGKLCNIRPVGIYIRPVDNHTENTRTDEWKLMWKIYNFLFQTQETHTLMGYFH